MEDIFCGKERYSSTNEMAFKRTVTLRKFSISRRQIWCTHAIVVQRMHACMQNALLLFKTVRLLNLSWVIVKRSHVYL